MQQRQALTVAGAGPGVGLSVARRLGREGYSVGLIARNRERLDAMAEVLSRDGVPAVATVADLHHTARLNTTFDELKVRLGPTPVLCLSPLPDVALIKPVAETTAQDLGAALSLNVVAAATAIGFATLVVVTGIPASSQAALRAELSRLGTGLLPAGAMPDGDPPVKLSPAAEAMVARIGPVEALTG